MGVFSRIFEEFTVNKDKRFYDISRPQSKKLDQKLSEAGWLNKKAGVGEFFPEKCRRNMENGQYRHICPSQKLFMPGDLDFCRKLP